MDSDTAAGLARLLQLSEPLVVFDLETTGVDTSSDRICSAAFISIEPDGRVACWSSLIYPTVPIPADATEVHGISNEMVQGKPSFAEVAADLEAIVGGLPVCAYNGLRFDVPMLRAEFARCGIDWSPPAVVDPFLIWQKVEPRTLEGAFARFCGRKLDGAHAAEADAAAVSMVLLAQLSRFADQLGGGVEALDRLVRDPSWIDSTGRVVWNEAGEAALSITKHAGTPLRELARTERGLLSWIIGKDFPEDTKQIVREALRGAFPSRDRAA